MSDRWYRYDDGQDFSMNPWDRARLDGNDELADRLEAEANRALAARLGWEMPVVGLTFNEDEYPRIAAEHDREEAKW